MLRLVEAMASHDAPEHTKLWAMLETPYAMLHAAEIAGADERLTVLVMGTNDLAKELYAEHVPGRQPLLAGLGLSLLAARAAGKAILDGVYNDVKNTDGFLAECQQGREMGFDGKTLIHPGQVEGANAAFAPSSRGRRGRPRHPAGLGGRRRLRRSHLQRPDDREPPRRVRPAHPDPPRRHPCAGGGLGFRIVRTGMHVPGAKWAANWSELSGQSSRSDEQGSFTGPGQM